MRLMDGLAVDEGVGVGVRLGLGVILGVGVGVRVGEASDETLAMGVGEAVGMGVRGVLLGVAEAAAVPDGTQKPGEREQHMTE